MERFCSAHVALSLTCTWALYSTCNALVSRGWNIAEGPRGGRGGRGGHSGVHYLKTAKEYREEKSEPLEYYFFCSILILAGSRLNMT